MTRSIKLSDLRRAKACAEQVKLFKELFPRGATFETEAEAVAAAMAVVDWFNWEWATENLLSHTAWEAYLAASAEAWEDKAEAFARAWWNDKADKEDGR